MRQELEAYLEQLSVLNSSRSRIAGMEDSIEKLIRYLQELGIGRWADATEQEMAEFGEWIIREYWERAGKEPSPHSRQRWISCVKVFYRWLKQSGRILHDPAEQIRLPKTGHIQPRVLTESEVARLIATPDTSIPVGIRDRAMLEMFYGTGLRVGEMQRLELYDISLLNEEVIIKEGKGGRGRVLPLTQGVCYWLEKYLREARPILIKGYPLQKKKPHGNGLWISKIGTQMKLGTIELMIKRYARARGIEATAHTLRHSFATHLLRGGAHIEAIRELLGHRDLYSTQLYTHLTVADLKKVTRQADQETEPEID